MFPNGRPIHRLGATLDNDGRKFKAIAGTSDSVSQLIIIGEAILEAVEAPDFVKLFAPHRPGSRLDRLSSEIEMLLSGGKDGGLYIMIGRKMK